MAIALREVEDGFLSNEECEELLFIHRSCSAMGYRAGVQSTHLGHLVASNTAGLIVPILDVRERIRDLVEEKSGHRCMVFIEFTGLISWTAGSSIGWHHDSNRPYLTQRHYSMHVRAYYSHMRTTGVQAVCYLNDYGIDFTGGLFHFQDDEPSTIVPQSGRVAIYSAGEENIHSVDPVLSGERCTLTMWFTLEPTHDEDRTLIPRLIALPALIPLDQLDCPNSSEAELASSEVTKADPCCEKVKLSIVCSVEKHAKHAVFVQHKVPLPLEISPTMYTSAVPIAMKNSDVIQARGGQDDRTEESKRDEMTSRGVGSEREETGQDGALSTNGATLRMPVKDVLAEVGASRASVEDSGGAMRQQSSTSETGQEVQETGEPEVQDLRDEKLRELGLRLRKRESDGFLIMEDGGGNVAHVFASSLHALQVAAFCEWQGTSLAALADSGGTYHGISCPHRPKRINMKRPIKQATSDGCFDQKETAMSDEKRARLGTDSETLSCHHNSIHGIQRPRTGHEHNQGTDRLSNAETCKPQVESDSRFCEGREGDFAMASAATATYGEDKSVVVTKYRGVEDAVAGWECYINELWKKVVAALSSWQASGFLHGVGGNSAHHCT